MDKETTTSVTIDRKTFARLDRLAKSNNVSKKEFLSCALEYFEKYGINPVEHESPAKEMQKLIKRCDQVIAFIRKQEQDFLRPACEAMGSTSMRVTMSMDSILTEKKFSQYQKDNDLFMRDLASLAGIREQALDRAEKVVGQNSFFRGQACACNADPDHILRFWCVHQQYSIAMRRTQV